MNIKSKRGIFLALSWYLFLALTSCQDDEPEQLPAANQHGWTTFQDVKSLSLIKRTIRGTWKIHYAYGGFNGHTKVSLKDAWFRYLPNDSVYMVIEGVSYGATQATIAYKETVFGRDAWVIGIAYNSAVDLLSELLIDGLSSDTLVLGDHALDGYGYWMTKQ